MRGFELAAALMVSPRWWSQCWASPWHSFPLEGLFSWCKLPWYPPGFILPHVHVQPPSAPCSCSAPFHPLCLASYPPPFALEGAREAASSWCEGRKKMYTCCFGAGLFSYISSHGKTRRQEVPFSSLRQPGGGQEGSSPCLWAPGLALDNT